MQANQDQLSNPALSEQITNSANDAPRIEIKTLIHKLDSVPLTAQADKEFAQALNDGWEILDIQVTTQRVGNVSQHTRFVLLQMLIEPEAPKDEAEAKVEAAVEALIADETSKQTDTPAPAQAEAEAPVIVEPPLHDGDTKEDPPVVEPLPEVTEPDKDSEAIDWPVGVPVTMPLQGSAGVPVKRVSGVVMGAETVTSYDRKPLDEVSFVEALVSGLYSAEEVSAIGDREAADAGLRVMRERQQNRAGQQWESFVMRLPQAAQ